MYQVIQWIAHDLTDIDDIARYRGILCLRKSTTGWVLAIEDGPTYRVLIRVDFVRPRLDRVLLFLHRVCVLR